MAKRRQTPMPDSPPDASRLCTADHLRWYISTHPVWGGLTDAELGKRLKLSAGYVGMVMSGARPPTKAFLKAIRWEAVTLYQMKHPHNPHTVRRCDHDWCEPFDGLVKCKTCGMYQDSKRSKALDDLAEIDRDFL